MNYKVLLLVAASSLLCGALFRVVLPAGDEPDYLVRVFAVYNSLASSASPYALANDQLHDILMAVECEVRTHLAGFKYSIEGQNCSQSFSVVTYRLLLFAIHIVTFFSLIALSFGVRRKQDFWNTSLIRSCFVITPIFPAFIYYSGVFSLESWALVVSCCSLMFLSTPILFIVVCFYVATFDLGTSLLMALFFCFRYGLRFVFARYGLKTSIYIISTFLLAFYWAGNKFVRSLETVNWFGGKISVISAAYGTDRGIEVVEKYPLLFRPIISFLTFCLYTPSGVFAMPVVFVFGVHLSREIVRAFRSALSEDKIAIKKKEVSFEFLTALSFISAVIFIVPGYSNAKYYVFLIPALLSPFVLRYGLKSVYLTLMSGNLIIVIQLLISRV